MTEPVLAAAPPAQLVAATVTPWSWRVAADGWFKIAERCLVEWTPDPALRLDRAVKDRLIEAARGQEAWLYHPVMCAATLGERHAERDLRLTLWTGAHHGRDASLGAITVPEGAWAWSADGGCPVEPGRHDVAELGIRTSAREADAPVSISLDVWNDAVGLPLPPEVVAYEEWSWAHHQPVADEDAPRLRRDIVGFLRAVRMLEQAHPECAAWVAGVTKVVVPLYGTPDTRFRSGTCARLPGLVFSDIDGPPAQALESLVHESSHLWFCLAESSGPLVDPSHRGRYRSPLRPDARPLRGIFLAFHALAFMCAFYRDWAGLAGDRETTLAELDGVRTLRDDAASTVQAAREALTTAGAVFFDTTMELAVGHDG